MIIYINIYIILYIYIITYTCFIAHSLSKIRGPKHAPMASPGIPWDPHGIPWAFPLHFEDQLRRTLGTLLFSGILGDLKTAETEKAIPVVTVVIRIIPIFVHV